MGDACLLREIRRAGSGVLPVRAAFDGLEAEFHQRSAWSLHPPSRPPRARGDPLDPSGCREPAEAYGVPTPVAVGRHGVSSVE